MAWYVVNGGANCRGHQLPQPGMRVRFPSPAPTESLILQGISGVMVTGSTRRRGRPSPELGDRPTQGPPTAGPTASKPQLQLVGERPTTPDRAPCPARAPMWKRLVCEDGTVPVLADTGINMGSPDGSPRCRTSPDAGFSAVRRLHHRADEPLPHGCDALASSAIELVSSKPFAAPDVAASGEHQRLRRRMHGGRRSAPVPAADRGPPPGPHRRPALGDLHRLTRRRLTRRHRGTEPRVTQDARRRRGADTVRGNVVSLTSSRRRRPNRCSS